MKQNEQPTQAGMSSLQDILMQSIQDVRSGAMDASKAKAVNEIAQTLINSAKVEVEFMRATKRSESRFFQPGLESTPRKQGGTQQIVNGPWTGLVHHIKDDEE
ncbi:hypothetical protein [Diaphorobacter nitroreducens]